MAKTFHLTIAKVGENLYEGDAVSVTVPGSEGQLTVLGQHEPLVTTLKNGAIRVDSGIEKTSYQVENGGVLEISNNQATIIL